MSADLNGQVVDVAGVAMRLCASDDQRAAAITALFRHAVPVAVKPQCVVRFTDETVAVPDSEPVTVVQGLDLWRPAAGELVLRSARGLTARVTRDSVDVGGDAPTLAREFRYVAMIGLTHALAYHDRHLLHGGAVVCDERALLVLGGSGHGKSTLVLGALQSGWLALTDDLVAVQRRNGVAYAAGLPRPISVPLDVLTAEHADGPTVPDDPRERVELPATTFTRSSHPIAGVIVVARGDDRAARLDPLDSHDALRRLLSACSSLADPALMREVFTVAAGLARLPSWTLHHGSDPACRVDEARLRLEEIRLQLAAP
jgi:hypothetical protein